MKLYSEPSFDHRSMMVSDWNDENGRYVFQERTYWQQFPTRSNAPPGEWLGAVIRHLKAPPRSEYWITDALYTDETLAKADAAQYGFTPQLGFYCEVLEPHWFPIFNDNFDGALAYLKAKTGIDYSK